MKVRLQEAIKPLHQHYNFIMRKNFYKIIMSLKNPNP